MGGHANGQEASYLAIQTIVNCLLPRLSSDEPFNENALVNLLVEGLLGQGRHIASALISAMRIPGLALCKLLIGWRLLVSNRACARSACALAIIST